jgi:hypothetical protein
MIEDFIAALIITAGTLVFVAFFFYPYDLSHFRVHSVEGVVQNAEGSEWAMPDGGFGVIYKVWIDGNSYQVTGPGTLALHPPPKPGETVHLDCTEAFESLVGSPYACSFR